MKTKKPEHPIFRLLILPAAASSLLIALSAQAISLSPEEIFFRTASTLDHFGVPAESDSQPHLDHLQQVQTSDGISQALPFFDLSGAFRNYVRFEPSLGLLSAFQDPLSRRVPDFSVHLAYDPNQTFIPDFARRLRQARDNPKDRPLLGLRIALDPGHMGGEVWDRRTGKFVRDNRGNKLSEGVLNLQVALLLEKELSLLGAEVLLTRRTLSPITELDYERFDLREFALEELRQSQLQDWFQALLEKAPAGETLYRRFLASPEFKRIFSESMRSRFFINRADLLARAEMIQTFSPDLTLVIHFDTTGGGPGNGLNPRGYNATKAYVAGAFEKTEFASREDRRYFAQHLLDPITWRASVGLSESIVTNISTSLGIRLDPSGGSPSTRRVVPGVYSRNLHLTRKVTGAPLSYLECLFYNDPEEFAALLRNDHQMTIAGESHPYSNRLLQLVLAIRDGVVQFAQSPTTYP